MTRSTPGRCKSHLASCCSKARGCSTSRQRGVVGRPTRSGFNGCFIVTDDRQKIALAHEADRTARGAPDRRLVDSVERGTAIGLTHDLRMRHAVKRHVMDESRFAEELRRQIDARGVAADVIV